MGNRLVKLNNLVLDKNPNGPMPADILYTPTGTQKPILIFVHGFKGYKDWGTFNLVAEEFANAGFMLVKFNFSHNGGTIENPIDFPDLEAFGNNNYTKEQEDLKHVIDWMTNTAVIPDNEVDRSTIYLVGHSRGGGAVILKAFHDNRITKLVTWAAVSDFGARFKGYDIDGWNRDGVAYIMNGRTKQNMPLYYQFYEDFMKNEEALDIPKAAKGIDIPFLICHGTEDPAVPMSEANNLKEWNPNAELFTVEGAGHTFDGSHPWDKPELPLNLQSVVNRTVAFLKEQN